MTEKPHIEGEKANIEKQKPIIQKIFTAKTASHVGKGLTAFGFQRIFGRTDVQKTLGLKPTRCTVILKDMAEKGLIEPAVGFGKGKYRFRLDSF